MLKNKNIYSNLSIGALNQVQDDDTRYYSKTLEYLYIVALNQFVILCIFIE